MSRERCDLFGGDLVHKGPVIRGARGQSPVFLDHLFDLLLAESGPHPGYCRFRSELEDATDGVFRVLQGIEVVGIDVPK